LKLPPKFVQTIHDVFGRDGKLFIENIPSLIKEASARWGLTEVQPVPNLSYNFVAFAKQESSPFASPTGVLRKGQGEGNVILKIGVPNPELNSEMAALKLFNGEGACQLLECDEERGFLLLERLKPGTMLADLTDDDERTNIAIDVMSKLWREVPNNNNFIQLSVWFDALKKIRLKFNGGTGPFPTKLLEQVESNLPGLFVDKNVKLIHGDFHHFNVLSSDRGWLAIDPKGVIGPVGYEIGPLMINPWNSISDRVNFRAQTERRIRILSERLNLERENLIKWATAHAVLSACWDIQDNMDWNYSLWCAEIFSEIK
jgi:streptomycin 6-kinase